MSRRSPQVLLADLVQHAQRALEIVGGRTASELESDLVRRDAFLWNLIVIGEGAIRTPPDIKARHPEIPWQDIIAQRNVIAHGYDVLSWEILHRLAKNQLSGLVEAAQRALDSYGPPPG